MARLGPRWTTENEAFQSLVIIATALILHIGIHLLGAPPPTVIIIEGVRKFVSDFQRLQLCHFDLDAFLVCNFLSSDFAYLVEESLEMAIGILEKSNQLTLLFSYRFMNLIHLGEPPTQFCLPSLKHLLLKQVQPQDLTLKVVDVLFRDDFHWG